MVASVKANSPAELAGIQPNDVVVSVDGVDIFHPASLNDAVASGDGNPLSLVIRREGTLLDVTMTPVFPGFVGDAPPEEEQRRMVGIEWDRGGDMVIDHPGPNEQIRASVMAMVNTFDALFTKDSDIGAQHLSGPVGIMRIYYRLFDSDYGWRLALWFSVILNVNLALLNLLPVPVLDGGHIVMACIEGIIRRPIPFSILNYVQTGFALLVIGYMLYVSFFDVQDLGGGGQAQEYEIVFEAPQASTSQP